jgi:hypothetical protein
MLVSGSLMRDVDGFGVQADDARRIEYATVKLAAF